MIPESIGAAPAADSRKPLSVLVVDDQHAFRKAAALVINSMPQLRLVGEATDLATALTHATNFPRLDVAVIDLLLGDDDGIDLCRQLRALCPELAVVLVSTMDSIDLPWDAHTCGALGFIPKTRFGIGTLSEILGLATDLT